MATNEKIEEITKILNTSYSTLSESFNSKNIYINFIGLPKCGIFFFISELCNFTNLNKQEINEEDYFLRQLKFMDQYEKEQTAIDNQHKQQIILNHTPLSMISIYNKAFKEKITSSHYSYLIKKENQIKNKFPRKNYNIYILKNIETSIKNNSSIKLDTLLLLNKYINDKINKDTNDHLILIQENENNNALIRKFIQQISVSETSR